MKRISLDRVWNVFVGVLAVAVLWGILSTHSPAAPKAALPDECMVWADMSMVVKAMAKANVDPGKVSIALRDIYNVGDDRTSGIADAIVTAAYRDKRSPVEFTRALLQACIGRQGDMDSVLGVSL